MSYIPFQKPPSISDAKRLYTSAKDDMPEEEAAALIMAARAPWFEEDNQEA